jgi:hypothetical protein
MTGPTPDLHDQGGPKYSTWKFKAMESNEDAVKVAAANPARPLHFPSPGRSADDAHDNQERENRANREPGGPRRLATSSRATRHDFADPCDMKKSSVATITQYVRAWVVRHGLPAREKFHTMPLGVQLFAVTHNPTMACVGKKSSTPSFVRTRV